MWQSNFAGGRSRIERFCLSLPSSAQAASRFVLVQEPSRRKPALATIVSNIEDRSEQPREPRMMELLEDAHIPPAAPSRAPATHSVVPHAWHHIGSHVGGHSAPSKVVVSSARGPSWC